MSVKWRKITKWRHVPFDVIGLSYYPKWHRTMADLSFTTNHLSKKFSKDVVVAEYSKPKQEVNSIAFDVDSNRGKGNFIREPIGNWYKVFDEHEKQTIC